MADPNQSGLQKDLQRLLHQTLNSTTATIQDRLQRQELHLDGLEGPVYQVTGLVINSTISKKWTKKKRQTTIF